MRVCRCKPNEACDVSELSLKAHFPYLELTMEGEVIIPRDKIEDFVRRYDAVVDAEDHLAHLRAYRASGARKPVTDADD